MTPIVITPVDSMPDVVEGDDLARLVAAHVDGQLTTYDVVVITSKVVSKAAGLVTTSDRESLLDAATDRVVARKGPTRIVRTHGGLTMAAAGLDASNTKPGTVVALSPHPDADAARLRDELMGIYPAARHLGVVITDTAGRPWRVGQTDIAIGCAGIKPARSYAGERDAYGNELQVTVPAIADEIAGAAELATGKVAGLPVAVVRGLDPALFCDDAGPGADSLVRAEHEDLFGLGAHEAVRAAVGTSQTRPRGFADVDEDPIDAALAAVDPAVLTVVPSDSSIVVSPHPTASRDDALMAVGALQERLRILDRAYDTHHQIQVREL